MGLLFNWVTRESLKAGDHIYSWRTAYIYAHHGIYIGDDQVIHFTSRGQEVGTGTVLDVLLISSGPARYQEICPNCISSQDDHGVVASCLNCFLAGGVLYRFEYAVSRALFLVKARGGTCTTAVSDEDNVVVHRALYLLENGFRCYNVFKNNCEHFAIYCKTGLVDGDERTIGQSGQAVSIIGGPLAAVLSTPLRLVTTNVYGMAAAVGVYCASRYAADIGMRRDVVKIQVEDLLRLGLLSNRVTRESLKAGDHIYSWRNAYIYAHHGIYIGDDKVIHFTRHGQEVGTGTVLDVLLLSSGPAKSQEICPNCIPSQDGHRVVVSCLNCFLAGGVLHRFEYAVSPALFLAKARGGTCTLAVSDEDDVVVHRALYLLKNGFRCYNVFKNCEHFAIYCKTGLVVVNERTIGQSGQAVSIIVGRMLSVVARLISNQTSSRWSPLRLVTTNVYGMAATAVGGYCASRYAADIGMRRDVVKIQVEDLVRLFK